MCNKKLEDIEEAERLVQEGINLRLYQKEIYDKFSIKFDESFKDAFTKLENDIGKLESSEIALIYKFVGIFKNKLLNT